MSRDANTLHVNINKDVAKREKLQKSNWFCLFKIFHCEYGFTPNYLSLSHPISSVPLCKLRVGREISRQERNMDCSCNLALMLGFSQ